MTAPIFSSLQQRLPLQSEAGLCRTGNIPYKLQIPGLLASSLAHLKPTGLRALCLKRAETTRKEMVLLRRMLKRQECLFLLAPYFKSKIIKV